jgi:hypothetical protein
MGIMDWIAVAQDYRQLAGTSEYCSMALVVTETLLIDKDIYFPERA